MIAIETKFHGATNRIAARASAVCCICHRRTYVKYDAQLRSDSNHKLAAEHHLSKRHRRLDIDNKLHLSIGVGYEVREGYVFPLIPCEPY